MGKAGERTPECSVPVLYQATWQDGFGARGWKLREAAEEGEVIAATPYPGERIPTSVFIHDILDHWVPGFSLSGHRSEAKALVQLAARTGSDPVPDYGQMVDEDLLRGDCHGEALETFLPPELADRLPAEGPDRARMRALVEELGAGLVRATLIARFVELGWAGMEEAQAGWLARGLVYERRASMGLALQALFERVDARALEAGWAEADGEVGLARDHVAFRIHQPEAMEEVRPLEA
ncbi:hypothetical protein AN478_01390 [Thiohalorhabdus denitrificans]|uniref:Uncharacterized protein n=1 Tax=Thiohalorhabdus denitrificans TaxID=381306 RepID=A0A0P9C9H0_9GAMM|nr:hypothetical protein [Thiohalorhabdus denitrificans]KPV41747.1 hypothetical protein AN478_01390 [Thiohalorhabdus denitrificans]SCY53487.1 hypothetical protein SAMN05661077_2390 [Thiohalorhabdus denitrificans]